MHPAQGDLAHQRTGEATRPLHRRRRAAPPSAPGPDPGGFCPVVEPVRENGASLGTGEATTLAGGAAPSADPCQESEGRGPGGRDHLVNAPGGPLLALHLACSAWYPEDRR